jgi:proteasome lid subunit RPN8/RPN11
MSQRSSAKSQKPASKPAAKALEPKIEPRIEIDGEVTRRIRQHARAHLKTEVCGVLIGDDLAGAIDIRASIEALTATQGGTHVTFTQDAWEEIYRVKDEQYPDDRIVGWYHSHPGFGVFLSDHDLFIQQNFFSSPGQVAWVYDPHTDEEGCFGWVNGEIRRLSSLQVMDRSGSGVDHSARQLTSYAASDEEEEEFEPRMQKSRGPATMKTKLLRWSVMFLSYAAVLALGYMLAFFLLPRIVTMAIDPATGQPYQVDEQSLMQYLRHAPDPEHEIKSAPAPAQPATPTPSPTPGSHP